MSVTGGILGFLVAPTTRKLNK